MNQCFQQKITRKKWQEIYRWKKRCGRWLQGMGLVCISKASLKICTTTGSPVLTGYRTEWQWRWGSGNTRQLIPQRNTLTFPGEAVAVLAVWGYSQATHGEGRRTELASVVVGDTWKSIRGAALPFCELSRRMILNDLSALSSQWHWKRRRPSPLQQFLYFNTTGILTLWAQECCCGDGPAFCGTFSSMAFLCALNSRSRPPSSRRYNSKCLWTFQVSPRDTRALQSEPMH